MPYMTADPDRDNMTDKKQLAFDAIKYKLASQPILALPMARGHIMTDTDYSQYAVRAMLLP